MKLAVPIFKDGKIYNEVEFVKPRAGVLTKAYKALQTSGAYPCVMELLAGSITMLQSMDGEIIDNQMAIRNLLCFLPYVSAEMVALDIMSTLNKDDYIEGVYNCPRCNEKIIDGFNNITMEDTRPKISELKRVVMKESDYNNEITVKPEQAANIINKRTGETVHSISEFTVRFPVLIDCIKASTGMQKGDDVAVQMKLYQYSIQKINGQEVDQKWIATYGPLLFDCLYNDDIQQIPDVMNKYGVMKTIPKICNNCGKDWDAMVNTSNFFASGLRPD